MSWLTTNPEHPLWQAGGWVSLALVALLLRQLTQRSRLAHHLDGPLSLIAFGVFAGGVAIVARFAGLTGLTPYLDAIVLGALAIGAVRVALTLFEDFYLRRRRGAVVSAIVRDVATIVAYFVVLVVVLRTTLDINVTSVIATSAVLTAIIGLALQDQLGNLFGGLVLEIEAPFVRGDWVRLGEFEGVIEETGWRTTKLRTRVNEIVILPNATLSKQPIVNYTRPSPLYGDTLRFDVGYEIPPNMVKEVVTSVLRADAAVQASPELEVRTHHFGENGVHYAVRYWIIDYGALERIRDRLHTNLWYALRRDGVRVPLPGRELFVYPGSPPSLTPEAVDVVARLRAVPLLAPLDRAAWERLGPRVRRQMFGRGEAIVREGEAGDSFFVIESGRAQVLLGDGGDERVIGDLAGGAVFGEMSLLAGDPRSATVRALTDLVVAVIDRDAFKEIVAANPGLLGPISELAAHRHAEQERHRSASGPETAETEIQRVQGLRQRILRFFGFQ